MKIIDTTTYFEERMMMELRFNILDPYVDNFIVCEARFSHSGKDKDINFNKKDFPKFEDKIIHLIVDKEPTGLRGEVLETLKMLKERGKYLVLGLRDVLDSSAALEPEWKRKNVLPVLRKLYDEIWIYGLPQIYEPLNDLPLPKKVLDKITYTGYLRRSVKNTSNSMDRFFPEKEPYLLVTPGGGGDGEELIEWVLSAYENDPLLPYAALFVLGPFMQPELQEEFMKRCKKMKRIHVITFDVQMEDLESNAAGIVAMGGYNTFCEILSLDKKAIIEFEKMQLGDVKNTYADIDKAKQKLGFSPRVDVEKGIDNFINWYLDYSKSAKSFHSNLV